MGEKFWQVCQRVFRGNFAPFFIFFLLLGGNETRKNRGEVPAEKCLLRNCIPLLEVRFLPKQFVTTIKKVHRIDPAVLYRASGIFKKCEFFFGCICNHFHDFLCFSLYENYLVVFLGSAAAALFMHLTYRTKAIKISSLFLVGMQYKWGVGIVFFQ